MQFPAVLCTKWYPAVIDEMRQYLRFIPSLIDSAPSSIPPPYQDRHRIRAFANSDGDYRAGSPPVARTRTGRRYSQDWIRGASLHS